VWPRDARGSSRRSGARSPGIGSGSRRVKSNGFQSSHREVSAMPLKSRLLSGACRTAELKFESPLERVENQTLQTKFVAFHPFALGTLVDVGAPRGRRGRWSSAGLPKSTGLGRGADPTTAPGAATAIRSSWTPMLPARNSSNSSGSTRTRTASRSTRTASWALTPT
jgi:hypothetical protein